MFRSTLWPRSSSDEHRQVGPPGAYRLRVLPPHYPGYLSYMAEVVRNPGGEQLAESTGAKLRVAAAALEVGSGEVERLEPKQVAGPQLGKRIQQLVQCFPAGSLELGETVEWREGASLTMRQQDLGSCHPIGAFTVDQMANDIEGAPGIRPLGAQGPGFRNIPEQRADY